MTWLGSTGKVLHGLGACLLFLWLEGVEASAGWNEHPLAPPDRSSPRATLLSFIANANAAYTSYVNHESMDVVGHAFRRAVDCLDLSDVAPTLHFDVGGYTVLLLKEILDRIELPPTDEIPDEEAAQQRWTIPHSEISIIRVKEGELAGLYLFSPRTISRAQEFFERVRDLPHRPGTTPGLLDIYLDNPGGLVPFDWARELPDWAVVRVLERPIWKWVAVLGFCFLAILVLIGVRRLERRWGQRICLASTYFRYTPVWTALALVLLAWALDVFVDDVIGLRGGVETWFKRGALIVSFTAIVFLVFAVFELLASFIVASTRDKQNAADAHMVRWLVRLVGIAVNVSVVVEASEYLGWAVAPVAAGLGVGGIAVALAARPTLENVIGGLTLFADRPFRVGDLCNFGDQKGYVEEVGLRSTRVRTPERSLLSIPNADLAVMKIENLGHRDLRLLRRTMGLRYETTADQLRWVLAKIREMLLAHPMAEADRTRVRFIGYGAYSLDIEVYVYLKCQSTDSFLAISEDVLLRIMDIVNESGTAFAFPSQVNYIRQDPGVDSERQAEREAEVERWRQGGKLPFPDIGDEERNILENTLDYPPRGSPTSRACP